MLNLGFETTSSIKKRIADFAGVPRGFALGDLRESSVTLMRGSSKNGQGSKGQITTQTISDDEFHKVAGHQMSAEV